MKKLIAGALAVATVASLSVTSFAAWTAGTDKENEVLTFTNYAVGTAGTSTAFSADDTVQPSKTLYLPVPATVGNATAAQLVDSDYFKFKADKEAGSKLVKSVKLVEKTVGSFDAARQNYIEIALNEDMTTNETKVVLDFTFTKTSKDGTAITDVTAGDTATGSVTFYVANTEDKADKDYNAGEGGVVLKPTKDDENEIVWNDENSEIAALNFVADSDAKAFFPKLSTKWDNDEYAAKFANQNAFIRSFVGTPSISSTSRATLTLYNPYVNEDGELTVAAENVVIYEVVDGELKDVTKYFKAGINDNGDEVFTLRTRTLGTYIIAEAAAVENAAAEAPTTEDGKVVPNTGR